MTERQEAQHLLDNLIGDTSVGKVSAFVARVGTICQWRSTLLVKYNATLIFKKLFEEDNSLSDEERLKIFKEDLDRKREYIDFLYFYLENED